MLTLLQIRDSLEWNEERDTAFVKLEAPREVVELIRDIHEDHLSNDVIYALIYNIVDYLLEYIAEPEDYRGDPVEYVLSCFDTWVTLTANQLRWLNEVNDSFSRVDEVLQDGVKSLSSAIARAMLYHIEEITIKIMKATELSDSEEDDEDEEDFQ